MHTQIYIYWYIVDMYWEDNSIEIFTTYEKTGPKRSLNDRIFKFLIPSMLNTVYLFFYGTEDQTEDMLKQVLCHWAMALLLFQNAKSVICKINIENGQDLSN